MSNALGIIGVIVLVAIFVGAKLLFNRLWNKGWNAAERAIRSNKAAAEDDQLQTVLVFNAAANINMIRQAIMQHVPLNPKEGLLKNLFKIESLTAQEFEGGIVWDGYDGGDTFRVELLYTQTADGRLAAQYSIVSHTRNSAISLCIETLANLRNAVVRAFQSVDPNVYIEARTQELKHKMSWF